MLISSEKDVVGDLMFKDIEDRLLNVILSKDDQPIQPKITMFCDDGIGEMVIVVRVGIDIDNLRYRSYNRLLKYIKKTYKYDRVEVIITRDTDKFDNVRVNNIYRISKYEEYLLLTNNILILPKLSRYLGGAYPSIEIYNKNGTTSHVKHCIKLISQFIFEDLQKWWRDIKV